MADYQATLVQNGDIVDYTPSGADVEPGDVVVDGALVGISSLLIEDGVLGSLQTSGIFNIVKITGVLNRGVDVYWDATGDPQGGVGGSGALTTVAASNTFVGWCTQAALSADEIVEVKLANVQGNAFKGDLSTLIADPGDGNAIPVTQSGTCNMTSGGSETRTLAAPTFAGQQIALTHTVDGGAIAVTASATVNQTGNTIMTFTEVDDAILLYGILIGASTYEWRVNANDGAVLS